MIRAAAPISMFALCLAAGCVLRTPTLVARTSSALPSGPGPGPGPAPADAPAEDGQLIEAGCTFTGLEIKGEPGSLHQVACPAGCDKAVNVYGTDDYTADSPVCAAAMHAGAISDRGGEATVRVEPGRPAYRGTKRRGVASHDYGQYRASFRFEGVPSVPAEPVAVAAPVVIEAGCSFRGAEIRGEPGSIHRVSCPAGCTTGGGVLWGSDPYTADSPICPAAIHAGLATERGGEVTVILMEGKPAYRGSKRNGMQSGDYGPYRGSFGFRR